MCKDVYRGADAVPLSWQQRAEQLAKYFVELAEFSPYPDFEDADGSCYFCGEKNEHSKTCLWKLADDIKRAGERQGG
jgi:hypothetical protein